MCSFFDLRATQNVHASIDDTIKHKNILLFCTVVIALIALIVSMSERKNR